jgi:hypothetical protein
MTTAKADMKAPTYRYSVKRNDVAPWAMALWISAHRATTLWSFRPSSSSTSESPSASSSSSFLLRSRGRR